METTQQIGAHRVKVWEEGHGPPVVFFYDSWHTSHGFYAVSDHLSEKHRVLSMDPPGFGASPGASDLSLDLNDYAELFGEFVRYAGIRGVTLALCDLGLPIGLNFLAEGTDAVEIT
jgi:pimeloyl-ACP methyl ester carboxylesterase